MDDGVALVLGLISLFIILVIHNGQWQALLAIPAFILAFIVVILIAGVFFALFVAPLVHLGFKARYPYDLFHFCPLLFRPHINRKYPEGVKERLLPKEKLRYIRFDLPISFDKCNERTRGSYYPLNDMGSHTTLPPVGRLKQFR